MMTSNTAVKYHPSDDQLIDFSAGSLPMSRALTISAHIDQCAVCQQNINKLQLLGSIQLETIASQPVADTVKASVLAKISAAKQHPTPRPKPAAEQAPKRVGGLTIPRCLSRWVPDDYQSIKWTKITSSVFLSELCTDGNGAKASLVKVKAGGSMAHHGHSGEEVTVILQGSFSDQDGSYNPGDFIFRKSGDKHQPVATHDQDCICLIVLDGPVQFTGFFTRLLNPFLRLTHPVPSF
ncbi:Anti-sigma-E factor ChrR [Sinobacterium norvegicum]|uniref:Anti-sigma-E factor ChrR n=1 Tax=Sinobacterium norvegicum TaxID=1641715 RepID=A0ABN8EK62_9GAMM|nr:ChrR family anti-sigma-E factor [Sinobacterium norvegicum]CAH0991222.1 Anti-sigma-E factor ChrR [Sinobacterium norvegicum]